MPDIPVNPPINLPSGVPTWALPISDPEHFFVDTRTAQFGIIEFKYARANEDVKNPPVGHGLPSGVSNRLFYNLNIDGYQGLPPGSCLQRSQFMNSNDPQKATCARTENQDLLRNWSQAQNGVGFQNVLFKNLTVKNAIRTINAESGDLLPHTDIFQTYYGGSSPEHPTAQWLAIQDSEFKNSDNSIMISGGNGAQRGVLYQNLKAGFCDAWFAKDAKARVDNDFINKGKTPPTSNFHFCTNSMMAQTLEKGNIWLINSEASGSILANPNGGNLILIGSSRQQSFRQDVNIGQTCNYEFIEDALNDKNTLDDGCGNFVKPPFIELSCSGWRKPPAGCETRQGYLN